MNKRLLSLTALIMALLLMLTACLPTETEEGGGTHNGSRIFSLEDIPEFDGETPYVEINGNVPFFTEKEITAVSFEEYSELDTLGRCSVATASVGIDIMPTEDRGSIAGVKPSGWHTVKYDIISTKYLYNRCHLIGYQLTGENAREENLVTGTRFMNVDGMLPFENMVAAYVKETENHVMYRVTPIFKDTELVCRGVLMEAMSVEDNGEDILFCVYVYNNQPGITINYQNGESYLSGGKPESPSTPSAPDTDSRHEIAGVFILNTSSMKIHKESCRYADSISEKNREIYTGLYSDLITNGYDPCGTCKPSEIFE